MTLLRGDVVVARLNPNQGAEIGKLRPVVILTQTRLIEASLPVLFVVPLSSQFFTQFSALRVEIAPRDRLLKSSYAVLEQARSIDLSLISSNFCLVNGSQWIAKTAISSGSHNRQCVIM